MIVAAGCRRAAARIACRPGARLRPVTGSGLTMTASENPAVAAARRNDLRLNAFQPAAKVMIRCPAQLPSAAQQAWVEGTLEAQHGRVQSRSHARPRARRWSSDPPSSSTAACGPVRPLRCAAARAAQGRCRSARVIPAPRSHHPQTDVRTGRQTAATPIFHVLGKQRVVLENWAEHRQVDHFGIGDEKRRVRVADVWLQTGSASGPSAKGMCSVVNRWASGISSQPVRTGPISTAMRSSDNTSASSSPATVSICIRVSPVSRGAAGRLHNASRYHRPRPLHRRDCGCASSPGPPDGAAAGAGSPGRNRYRFGDPPARTALPGIDGNRCAPAVEHDEVVAEAVHFEESDLAHWRRLYGRAYVSVQRSPLWRREPAAKKNLYKPRCALSLEESRLSGNVACARRRDYRRLPGGMPDLTCFVALPLLVPLLPETLAALAERGPRCYLPPFLFFPASVCHPWRAERGKNFIIFDPARESRTQ